MPVDYRRLSLRSILFGEHRYLNWLWYWLFYGIAFYALERLYTPAVWHPVSCALDAFVPFCEYFVFPYVFWFVFIIGMLAYTVFFEPQAFRGMMKFIVFSYTAALIIYFVYPNCQNLRPHSFTEPNVLTDFMRAYYVFDTNTNVCPSLHVIGSAAVAATAWNTERFGTKAWRVVFCLVAFVISISTVFLKQHSVLDLAFALPVCAGAYGVAFGKKK